MKTLPLLSVTALGLCAAVAQAQPIDAESLRAYVQEQVSVAAGRAEVTIGDIDTRALAPCAKTEAFLPAGARLWGRGTVGVRCTQGANWSTYVPIHVRIWGPALVTTRGLAAGQPLDAADVRIEEVELTREQPGLLNDPEQIENRVLVRTLAAGQPIRANYTRARPVVSSGEQVKLTYSGNGFQVSAEGRALAPAVDGQNVRVQTGSGKILTGIARPGGVVEIRS